MTSAPQPFTIRIPEQDLRDLHHRLTMTRWPGDLENGDWRHGTPEPVLRSLLAAWRDDYDWRVHESAINRYPHYLVTVAGQTLHYVHVRQQDSIPLLLIGGWPQTFWDFAEVFPRLPDFELVVPDIPGQGWSSPLSRTGIGVVETAELLHTLMTRVLGHERYGIYGTDWGALIGEHIAHQHPANVIGLHTTMPMPMDFSPTNRTRPAWGADEAVRAEAAASQAGSGSGYLMMQATRPQTVAYLADSPAAMAAWIVDKVHRWTDHDGDFETAYPRDWLLTTLSIYWHTRTLGSAARFYYETFRRTWEPPAGRRRLIDVPTAVAAYPKETGAYPRAWVEEYFDLRRYTTMPRGGHFPAVESPDTLAADIAAFFADPTASPTARKAPETRGSRREDSDVASGKT